MLPLNYFPALLILKEKKILRSLLSLQYFCSRYLIQYPFSPSQEYQISDFGILFGDPCSSNKVSIEQVSNKRTYSS